MATGVEDIVQVIPELAEMTAKWHAANGVVQDMAQLVAEGDERERALRAEIERLRSLLPIAWAINDALDIDGDDVTFEGSQNDVEAFRDLLHKIDPSFNGGRSGPE